MAGDSKGLMNHLQAVEVPPAEEALAPVAQPAPTPPRVVTKAKAATVRTTGAISPSAKAAIDELDQAGLARLLDNKELGAAPRNYAKSRVTEAPPAEPVIEAAPPAEPIIPTKVPSKPRKTSVGTEADRARRLRRKLEVSDQKLAITKTGQPIEAVLVDIGGAQGVKVFVAHIPPNLSLTPVDMVPTERVALENPLVIWHGAEEPATVKQTDANLKRAREDGHDGIIFRGDPNNTESKPVLWDLRARQLAAAEKVQAITREAKPVTREQPTEFRIPDVPEEGALPPEQRPSAVRTRKVKPEAPTKTALRKKLDDLDGTLFDLHNRLLNERGVGGSTKDTRLLIKRVTAERENIAAQLGIAPRIQDVVVQQAKETASAFREILSTETPLDEGGAFAGMEGLRVELPVKPPTKTVQPPNKAAEKPVARPRQRPLKEKPAEPHPETEEPKTAMEEAIEKGLEEFNKRKGLPKKIEGGADAVDDARRSLKRYLSSEPYDAQAAHDEASDLMAREILRRVMEDPNYDFRPGPLEESDTVPLWMPSTLRPKMLGQPSFLNPEGKFVTADDASIHVELATRILGREQRYEQELQESPDFLSVADVYFTDTIDELLIRGYVRVGSEPRSPAQIRRGKKHSFTIQAANRDGIKRAAQAIVNSGYLDSMVHYDIGLNNKAPAEHGSEIASVLARLGGENRSIAYKARNDPTHYDPELEAHRVEVGRNKNDLIDPDREGRLHGCD